MSQPIDYNALFGIEDAGAEVTEPAEPSEETAAVEGEEAGEIADPSDDITQEPADGVDSGEDKPGEEGQPQTPQERARYAAARRKAEAQRDAAVEQARKEAREEADRILSDAFAKTGLMNPYTKQPIRTRAEFEAFDKQRQEESRKSFMKKNGMNDEQYDAFVASLPEVQAAAEAKARADQQERAAREQEARAKLDDQVKQISKLDPAIRDLESLIRSENYDKVYGLVQKGYELADAFRIVHFDRLSQKQVAAARQQTTNSARSKSHMSQTAARGAGAVNVPADIKAQYRSMIPGITDAEIQRHYASYMKK